jgi:DNA-binding CsgD family transcriptional regulator/tetratricopeptide (TPR) repeat protein
MIGRGRELELLRAGRREAASGRGGIALVSGEAGIGKSRLLREFGAQPGSGSAIRGAGRCVQFAARPLAPLKEALAGIGPSVPHGAPDATSALIERLTFERAPKGAPESSVGELFEAIESAFLHVARRRTLVLTFEDIHWADRSTLAFLAWFAARIAERRVFVVASYRSDELGFEHGALAEFASLLRSAPLTSIELRRLDAVETQRLAETNLPYPDALPPDVLAEIAFRSDGNPFFIEELVKEALARPARGDGGLPSSVRTTVLARAAACSPAEREILCLAALLGQRFSVERLVSSSGRPRPAVLAALERGRSLNLLVEGDGPSGTMAFRHSLTREVLYGELLKERARPLHRSIGLELEAQGDRDAVVVELAHHWWHAGDGARAARYCEAAGDRALALAAAADAVVYFERALRDAPASVATQARLAHKLGLAFAMLGRPAVALARLGAARDLYLRAGDLDGFARNAIALGAQRYNAGDVDAAMDCWREALERAGSAASAASLARLRSRIAYSSAAALDFETALELAADVPDDADDPLATSFFRQARLKAFAMSGRADAWRDEIALALRAAQQLDDGGATLRWTHCQIALDAMAFGDSPRARRHFELAIASATGNAAFTALILSAAALEAVLRGEFSVAARTLARAQALPGEEYTTGIHLRCAGLALGICAGDDALLRWDDAEAFLEHGIARGMRLVVGLLAGPYAYALAANGRLDGARRWIHRVVATVPSAHRFPFAFLACAEFGAADDVAAMRVLLAGALERGNDPVTPALLGLADACARGRGLEAGTAFESGRRAAERFAELGWPWFSAKALEAAGDSAGALAAYRELGARRDVRRLEGLAAGSFETGILSSREREVAEMVGRAQSNETIARELGISRRTVEKHVSAALDKLGFRSRAQLARFVTHGRSGLTGERLP